jgi:prevent-host-death family protein
MSTKKKSLVEQVLPEIGVRELRQNASIYLDRVKKGEKFVITEWGHPVGILGPIANATFEEMIEAGFITPAVDPNVDFSKAIITLPRGVSATELLLESRRNERS